MIGCRYRYRHSSFMALHIWFDNPPCVTCGHGGSVWERNPTYNLGPMWQEAGLPFSDESIEGKPCFEMLPALEAGLAVLKAEPARFRKLNPPNGWGDYEGLVEVVESAIAAARKYPNAIVRCGR